MSDQAAGDFEDIIRRALAPVDPPEDLPMRLESTLRSLTEMAADELEGWEIASMRDPRNWVRPVAALTIGTAAGAGLLVLRMRNQHRRQRSVRAAADEVRRLVRR
ncbi:MAG: hypothetical protein QOF29_1588 [bacterium]|jgi:hypothetical protein|nr:hypothetical protein [Solirubrobacteraceae bacterium]